jgi:hypothetical protein
MKQLEIIENFIRSIEMDRNDLDLSLGMKKDPTERISILKQLINLTNLLLLFAVVKDNTRDIEILKNAILNLPKRDEFNVVKSQIETHGEKIKSTLEPLKEEYDKWKEIQKRGEDTDAYS